MRNSIVWNSVDNIVYAQQAQQTGYQSGTDTYIGKQIFVR